MPAGEDRYLSDTANEDHNRSMEKPVGTPIVEQPQDPEHEVDVPQRHQEQDSTPVAETSELPQKQQYQCDRCGRVFFSASSIRAHIEVVHDGLKCTCEICGATMKWKSNLKVHMRKMHNVGDIVHKKKINRKCQRCGVIYTSNSLLAKHIRTVHKEDPFKCELCGETFGAGVSLSVHKLEHSEFVKYTCSVCGMRYMTSYPFQLHIKKTGHQQTTFQTNVVPERTQKDQGLEKVDQQQTASLTNVVAESMQSDKDLKRAGQQQTESQATVVPESIHNDHALQKAGHQQTAPESIQNEQGLENVGHHETASQQNVVSDSIKNDDGMVCPKCDCTFEYYHAFRLHVSNVNGCNNRGVKRGPRRKIRMVNYCNDTECKHCAEVFDTTYGLKLHMRSEHGVQVLDTASGKYRYKYPCTGCKMLLFANQLAYHHKMHAGIKDYSCDQCDYKCILEKDLRKHRFKHTGEKQFQCRFCSRQFSQKRSLEGHENKLHLQIGVKPYQCNVCQRQFDDRLYCAAHQKKCKGVIQLQSDCEQTLESRQIFRCLLCSAVYSDRSALTCHRKREHGQVPQKTPRKLNVRQSSYKVYPVIYHHCPLCPQFFTSFEALRKHEMKCFDRKMSRGNASGSESLGEGSGGSDTNNDGLSETSEESGTEGPGYSKRTAGSKYQPDQEYKQKYPTTDQGEPNLSCNNYCSTCGKSTAEMIRQVCPSHQVTCSFCKKVFKSDHDLEAHLTTKHLNEHVKPNSSSNACSTCGKTTQGLVQEHTANHFYNSDHSAVFETEENFLKTYIPRVVYL